MIYCVFNWDGFRTPAYRRSQLVDTAATNSQQMQHTKIEVSRHKFQVPKPYNCRPVRISLESPHWIYDQIYPQATIITVFIILQIQVLLARSCRVLHLFNCVPQQQLVSWKVAHCALYTSHLQVWWTSQRTWTISVRRWDSKRSDEIHSTHSMIQEIIQITLFIHC